jgi:hypothetical protein
MSRNQAQQLVPPVPALNPGMDVAPAGRVTTGTAGPSGQVGSFDPDLHIISMGRPAPSRPPAPGPTTATALARPEQISPQSMGAMLGALGIVAWSSRHPDLA